MIQHAAKAHAAPLAPCVTLALAAFIAGCDSNDDSAAPGDDPVPLGDPLTDHAVFDRDNYVELVAQVFAFYVGDALDERIENARFLATSQTNGEDGNDAVVSSHACINGGLVRIEAPDVFVFADCQVGESIYAGRVEAPFERYGLVTTSDGLSIRTEPNRSVEFSGTVLRSFVQTDEDSIGGWEAIGVDFRSVDASGSFAVEDADTEFDFGRNPERFVGTLEGGFTMRTPLTGDRPVDVRTIETFVYPADDISPTAASERNFTSGVLELSAANGDTLVFDAGNGDEDSVAITLRVGGETEAFTEPWSLWSDVRYTNR